MLEKKGLKSFRTIACFVTSCMADTLKFLMWGLGLLGWKDIWEYKILQKQMRYDIHVAQPRRQRDQNISALKFDSFMWK